MTYNDNPDIRKRSIIMKKISMLIAVVFVLGTMAQSALALHPELRDRWAP
jgi:hypothetical protein